MPERAGDRAPICPGPDPHPRPPTRYAVPRGAVDTHAHVIGVPPAYPFVASRSYTPPPASPSAYLAMLDATGMSYGVLVQVSVHGIDNRLLLETLGAHPKKLRGIAVVPLGLPERDYRALKEAGIVGLRLNTLYGGGIDFNEMESYGALCREHGWHLQFLLDARALGDLAPRFARLPVPFVVDHMGHFPTSAGVGHPGFQALVALVRDGAWVKLSGAYRLTVEGPPYSDTIAFALRLYDAAPQRCLWGSDWPHVANYGHMMNVGDLLDLLAEWVPDETGRQLILVDNPARLYGFGATDR
jgi:2-pyrone-4,6-dicarboxylate lactonase